MAITPELQRALRQTAEELAEVAAAECMPLFRSSDLDTANKATQGFDPVTQADRAAEEAMRAHLAVHRPDDAILGEEFPPKAGTSGLTWVLDPIDGTRAFLSGAPTWGILVAVDAGQGPVLGLIDQPHTRERFIGGFGHATLRYDGDTSPISVRSCAKLSDAILYSTFPEIVTDIERSAFEAVRDQVRLTRYGMDCYAYGLIAMGQIDLVIEAGLNPYDVQGPQAVIEGAGGIVSNWTGGPAHEGGQILAAGDARVHAAALEILSGITGQA
jgi:histidinol phosphatase-like enzyme (inositol monophosphatase family)